MVATTSLLLGLMVVPAARSSAFVLFAGNLARSSNSQSVSHSVSKVTDWDIWTAGGNDSTKRRTKGRYHVIRTCYQACLEERPTVICGLSAAIVAGGICRMFRLDAVSMSQAQAYPQLHTRAEDRAVCAMMETTRQQSCLICVHTFALLA